jgi:hypothetical protein
MNMAIAAKAVAWATVLVAALSVVSSPALAQLGSQKFADSSQFSPSSTPDDTKESAGSDAAPDFFKKFRQILSSFSFFIPRDDVQTAPPADEPKTDSDSASAEISQEDDPSKAVGPAKDAVKETPRQSPISDVAESVAPVQGNGGKAEDAGQGSSTGPGKSVEQKASDVSEKTSKIVPGLVKKIEDQSLPV